MTDSHRLRGQGEKLERGREKSFTGHRERGDISSGSAGFALIAPLELRFLEFRQASPIVPGPARIAANPSSGWLHAHRIHRTRPVQRGDSFIRSGVRSHGMLDRCNPCCSSSFTPFSSARARISTLLYIYVFVWGERKETKGKRISLRYRLKELSLRVGGRYITR